MPKTTQKKTTKSDDMTKKTRKVNKEKKDGKKKKKNKVPLNTDDRTSTISHGLTSLSSQISLTPNSKEWNKFMNYIEKRMATFDPNSSTYIDYEKREIERNQPPKRFIVMK